MSRSRRLRRPRASTSASGRPRSSSRLGSRNSSWRPRDWSHPPHSRRSAAPIPTSAPRTPTASPTATWCARFAGSSRAHPTSWLTPPTRRSSSACSRGARRRTPPRFRSAAARAWWAGWSRRAIVPRCPSTLRRLDRVLEVDSASRAARIQAGVTGPALEDQLRAHGLTLRHFPQSFEFSTLGGWIATRAGGHYATLYTHIDDFVESVRALTPRGWWESRRLPGVGRRAEPRPHADRLRGHPRRDHRGLDAAAGRAALQGIGGGPVRLVRAAARTRCAPCRSPASTRRTAGCSTRARRR